MDQSIRDFEQGEKRPVINLADGLNAPNMANGNASNGDNSKTAGEPPPSQQSDNIAEPRAIHSQNQHQSSDGDQEIKVEQGTAARDINGNIVSWDGPHDQQNPKNWPLGKKWTAVTIVSAFTLVSSISSSMVAPSLNVIKQDLQFESDVLSQMTLSIFVLAYGMSYLPPVLLHRKLRKTQQNAGQLTNYAVDGAQVTTLASKLRIGFARPIRLLFTQPIIICLALYVAYLYGIYYLILSSFTTLFTDHYHESIGIAGLNYIAVAIGFFIGAQGTARATDKVYAYLKARNKGRGRPEFRILIMIPCAIGAPIGLLWYGWSAHLRLILCPAQSLGTAWYPVTASLSSQHFHKVIKGQFALSTASVREYNPKLFAATHTSSHR